MENPKVSSNNFWMQIYRTTPNISRAITYGKNIHGLTAAPTILIQVQNKGQEDPHNMCMVDLEPRRNPIGEYDIDFKPEKPVTFSSAYISSETLLPCKDHFDEVSQDPDQIILQQCFVNELTEDELVFFNDIENVKEVVVGCHNIIKQEEIDYNCVDIKQEEIDSDCLNINIGEVNSECFDIKHEEVDSDENMQENDHIDNKEKSSQSDDLSNGEEEMKSSWIDNYIDEFEEEISQRKIDITNENIMTYLLKSGKVVKQDDHSEIYTIKPGPYLFCEKCQKKVNSATELLGHLEDDESCYEFYMLVMSSFEAREPEWKRSELSGYVEAFGCYMCSYMSYDPREIQNHWIKEHLQENPYYCKHCYAGFSTSYSACLHILKYHEEKPLIVTLSRSPMYDRTVEYDFEGLRDTLFTIPNIKEQQNFITSPFEIDSKYKNCFLLKCKSCSNIFDDVLDLRSHISFAHKSSLRNYPCSLCREKFRGQFDLRRHVVKQHKRLIGTGKKFYQNDYSQLDKFAKIVFYPEDGNVTKCYECAICKETAVMPERFNTIHAITMHFMEVHLALETLICPKCKGEKINDKLWCARCQQTIDISNCCLMDSVQENSLDLMRRVFTIFTCKACNYKSFEKNNLVGHIRQHHFVHKMQSRVISNLGDPLTKALEEFKKTNHSQVNKKGKPILYEELNFLYLSAFLEDLTESMIIKVPASDRDIHLFEGHEALNGGIECQEESVKVLKWTSRRAPNYKSKAIIKSYSKSVRMKPIVKEEGLYLDICSMSKGEGNELSSKLMFVHDIMDDDAFKCHFCLFKTNKHKALMQHLQSAHQTDQMGDQGPYWQCALCGYCAKDRSCLSRHVKYIHMVHRPHSCPYCDYCSIEKTKVRLHVMGNHKNQEMKVITDDQLLLAMSKTVKSYILLVEGGVKHLEAGKDKKVMDLNFTKSTRLHINTQNYKPPDKENFAPPTKRQRTDTTVEWAMYELEADKWINVSCPIPNEHKDDPKLNLKPTVVLKDIMLWMIKELQTEYAS